MKRSIAIAAAAFVSVLAVVTVNAASAENVLRWASAAEPLTYDPDSANHFPTIAANLQVYEPLVDFNSSSEIEPSLAVDWRLVDAITWQFDLRQGVRFHDGTPLTSEDVIFSLKRGTSSTSDFRTAVSPIAAVEAVDDHTSSQGVRGESSRGKLPFHGSVLATRKPLTLLRTSEPYRPR